MYDEPTDNVIASDDSEWLEEFLKPNLNPNKIQVNSVQPMVHWQRTLDPMEGYGDLIFDSTCLQVVGWAAIPVTLSPENK